MEEWVRIVMAIGYIHDIKIYSKKTGHIISFQNMEYL